MFCIRIPTFIKFQEVVPKPSDATNEKSWDAREYEVKKVKNLQGFEEGDNIDLGDKNFKVLHQTWVNNLISRVFKNDLVFSPLFDVGTKQILEVHVNHSKYLYE